MNKQLMSVKAQEKIWLTHDQIVEAINFHLIDERWFTEIPEKLSTWLSAKIPSKIFVYKKAWNKEMSGNRRLIHIMSVCGLDPFELCKYVGDNKNTTAMHNRFKNIIDTPNA